MNNRRTERGAFFPPFWKTDSHYVVVEFSKVLNLSEPEEVFIAAEGTYNVKLDGKLPVSYTHLDVYKRQADRQTATVPATGLGRWIRQCDDLLYNGESGQSRLSLTYL